MLVGLICACCATADDAAQRAASTEASEAEPVRVRVTHTAMATEFSIDMFGAPGTDPEALRSAAREAFDAVDALEASISNWQENSEVSRLNRAEAGARFDVSIGLYSIVEASRRLHADTDGAFDPTVGPLLALWGFYGKDNRVPDDDEIAEVLKRVGMDHVALEPATRSVRILQSGVGLDFGGIGKGMGLDVAAEVLKQFGVRRALLHSGTSTILALEPPPGQDGWTVRIKNPYNKEGWVDTVSLRNASLSTSAGYEQAFEVDGETYSHIFDPRTGYPVRGMLSATAIAPTGLESDGLSTAFFVMGREAVEAYCDEHDSVRAILVYDRDGAATPLRINFETERDDQ